MFFQVLSSGSKGNMTYIATNTTKILLDAGITFVNMKKRSELDFANIDAIFITHEHIDHAGSIDSIAKNTRAPIYVHNESYEIIKYKYMKNLLYSKINFISSHKQYKVGDIVIVPLTLSHDSVNCFGYIFTDNITTLAYITDTGFIPLEYLGLLSKVDSIIIEANHDVAMLLESTRPWPLKQRILSTSGHLSNLMCGQILNKLLEGEKISTIVLAHLSGECNDEDIALETINSYLPKNHTLKIYVARQDTALPLLKV